MKHSIILIVILLSLNLCYSQTSERGRINHNKAMWQLPLPKYTYVLDNEELKRYSVNMFDSALRIATDSAYTVTSVHDSFIYCIYENECGYTILTKFEDFVLSYFSFSKPCTKEGAQVKAGDALGVLTKRCTEPDYIIELHLWKNGTEIAPKRYFTW